MSKLTISNSERATLSFSMDQIRGMVNYESGKNKGYVRLMRAADGRLQLEKFNNKLDVSLSLRSRTGETESRILRAALARSLTANMFGATAAQKQQIERALLGAGDEAAAKPLSRREIRNALAKYDKIMNTPYARQSLVVGILRTAAAKTDYGDDYEAFAAERLGLRRGAMDDSFQDYYAEDRLRAPQWDAEQHAKGVATGDRYDVHGARHAGRPMKMSETDFVGLLTLLQSRADQAVQRCRLEGELAQALTDALGDPRDPFADAGLTAPVKARVRATLSSLLEAEGVNPRLGAGGAFGTAGFVFETFLDTLVPALFRQAREDLLALNDGAEQPVEAKSLISPDILLDHARAFFARVSQFADAHVAGDDAKTQDGYAAIFARQLEGLREGAVRQDAREALGFHTSMPKAAREALISQLARNFRALGPEEKIAQLALAYLRETCPAAVEAQRPAPTRETLVRAQLDKVLLAAKLNYGERWQDENGNYWQGDDVMAFVGQAGDAAAETVREYGTGGVEERRRQYVDLLETRLPRLVNARTAAAEGHADATRLNLDKSHLGELHKDFYVALKRAEAFDAAFAARAAKARGACARLLRALEARGALTANEVAYVRDHVLGPALRDVQGAARRRLMAAQPTRDIDDVAQALEVGRDDAAVCARAAIREVIAAVHRSVASLGLAKQLGGAGAETIVNAKVVDELLAGVHDPALGRLRPALDRLWQEHVVNRLSTLKAAKAQPDAAAFAEATIASFRAKGEALVKKATTFRAHARDFVLKAVTQTLGDNLKATKGAWAAYAKGLTRQEAKAFAAELAAEVVSRRVDAIDRALEHFLDHPEAYDKAGALDDLLIEHVIGEEGVDGIATAQREVIRLRTDAVRRWIGKAEAFFDGRAAVAAARLGEGADLPGDVVAALTAPGAAKVQQRVTDLGVFYAGSRTKAAFEARVTDEIVAQGQGVVTAFAKAARAFRANLAKLTGDYASLGAEAIEAEVQATLLRAARSKDPAHVTAKALGADLVNGLARRLDHTIDQIRADFDEYRELVEKADAQAARAKAAFAEAFARAAAGHLPEAVIAHVNGEILKRYHAVVDAQVCRAPARFLDEKWLKSFCEDAAWQAETMVRDARALDVNATAPDDVARVLRELGLGVAPESPLFAEVAELLHEYGRAEEVQAKMAPAMISAVERLFATMVEGRRASELPEEVRAPARAFAEALYNTLARVPGRLNLAAFNTMSYDLARELFTQWLDGYEKTYPLPQTTLEGGATVRSLAEGMFAQRYHDVATRLTQNETVDEGLLSEGFMMQLSAFFGTTALGVALDELVAGQSLALLEETTGVNRALYDVEAFKADAQRAVSPTMIAALARNRAALELHLDGAIRATRRDLAALDLTSYEGFARCAEQVRAIFARNAQAGLDALIDRCGARTSAESAILALHERVGGEMHGLVARLQVELTGKPAFDAICAKGFLANLVRAYEVRLDQLDDDLRRQVETGRFDGLSAYSTAGMDAFKTLRHDLAHGKDELSKQYQDVMKIRERAQKGV